MTTGSIALLVKAGDKQQAAAIHGMQRSLSTLSKRCLAEPTIKIHQMQSDLSGLMVFEQFVQPTILQRRDQVNG